ncbi:MAG: 23S rRNA pseudouridine2605 synthase [Planctomycetota bacterium]|jgi:23S rRNA pseudouridine2605 synthase
MIRLNKYMADHGIASRRRCDELITEGKVMIDGEIITQLGTIVDPEAQRVEIDGCILKPDKVNRRYYLLNKPAGVVCTNERRESKLRAIDMVTDRNKGRIYTVGRLDEDTVGLVILTSDGDFANLVMHPRYGVSKTYMVKIIGQIDDESLMKIRGGIFLSDGKTAGARVLVKKRSARQSTLLVTLHEGKNREVRRIFARFGWKVSALKRIRIGELTDRGLKVGHWRALKSSEVKILRELAEGTRQEGEQSEGRRKSPGAPKSRAQKGGRPNQFGGGRGARSGGPQNGARRRSR